MNESTRVTRGGHYRTKKGRERRDRYMLEISELTKI